MAHKPEINPADSLDNSISKQSSEIDENGIATDQLDRMLQIIRKELIAFPPQIFEPLDPSLEIDPDLNHLAKSVLINLCKNTSLLIPFSTSLIIQTDAQSPKFNFRITIYKILIENPAFAEIFIQAFVDKKMQELKQNSLARFVSIIYETLKELTLSGKIKKHWLKDIKETIAEEQNFLSGIYDLSPDVQE